MTGNSGSNFLFLTLASLINIPLWSQKTKPFLKSSSLQYLNHACFCSRDTTPSSEFHGMYSPAAVEKKENSHRRKSPAVKMPSQAEIDAFFAGAEREEQKRFAEK